MRPFISSDLTRRRALIPAWQRISIACFVAAATSVLPCERSISMVDPSLQCKYRLIAPYREYDTAPLRMNDVVFKRV
jgi:hypothetical protein